MFRYIGFLGLALAFAACKGRGPNAAEPDSYYGQKVKTARARIASNGVPATVDLLVEQPWCEDFYGSETKQVYKSDLSMVSTRSYKNSDGQVEGYDLPQTYRIEKPGAVEFEFEGATYLMKAYVSKSNAKPTILYQIDSRGEEYVFEPCQ